MTANELCGLYVSRETMERLQGYAALLEKWNAKINLVSASTLPDFWDRHIVDSAQLYAHAPESALNWVDLGSGGGLGTEDLDNLLNDLAETTWRGDRTVRIGGANPPRSRASDSAIEKMNQAGLRVTVNE